MSTTSAPPAAEGSARAVRRLRPKNLSGLGLAPFGIYVFLFLALPTILAVTTGFFDKSGNFTLSNVSALADPVVLHTFWNSIWLSALTAAVGSLVGVAICYALLGIPANSPVRTFIDAVAGVLAQFGGVMLAFLFIATIGRSSFIVTALRDAGIDIYASGMWLYDMPGIALVYIFFQIPLMVITFSPALQGLKPQWAEANLTLGGTRRTFWTKIGIPVLAPSFAASYLLLFANSFSAYATAAALASQGSQIIPLQIRAALTSETVLGRENLAGALAMGMIVVMALVMSGYSAIQRRADRWHL
ncbi:MAG: ABC transporter permease subunit [Propionibacteriaceae bacterium]|jgi:putative spermidine/putrescine transport system permease protein|nr:ABC transporter permease subunit [Propionibacteriaceae bacterium]